MSFFFILLDGDVSTLRFFYNEGVKQFTERNYIGRVASQISSVTENMNDSPGNQQFNSDMNQMSSALENNLKVSVGDENRSGTPLGGHMHSEPNTPSHSNDNRRDFSASGGNNDRRFMGKRRPFGRGNYHGGNRNGQNFSRFFENSNRNNQGYHSGGDHHRNNNDNYKNSSTNTPLHGQQSMNVDNSPAPENQHSQVGSQYQTSQMAGYLQPTYTQQAYQAFYPTEYEQPNYYMAPPYIQAPPQYSIFPGCKYIQNFYFQYP